MPTATLFKKGQPPGPGRPKGSRDKVTRDVKAMILAALDGAGGVDYLIERALDPKTAPAFLALLAKVVPMTVAGTGPDGGLVVEIVRYASDANSATQLLVAP